MLNEFVLAIETRLDEVLPSQSDYSKDLVEGMRYAVLNGGKRLRGSLVCATAYTISQSYDDALDTACAIECMHAYSLVHDDLPVMDDADLRRGKPSCHKVFGPAMATLVGDALQPFALNLILSCDALPVAKRLSIARSLGEAVGYAGMVGGQAKDIRLAEDLDLNLEGLRHLHRGKTGALFVSAVEMGRIVGESTPDQDRKERLLRFSEQLGEAFQVVDDLLDSHGSASETGKPVGQDARLGKQTFPAFLGEDGTKLHAERLLDNAMGELATLGFDDSPLAEVARLCVERVS